MAAQLFLRNTASDLGGAGQKALSTIRGSASTTAVTNTTASGTNIQVTTTGGGQALTWFSEQLPAQTLTGTVTVNIRGRESATSVNAGAGILIERTNSSGVVQSTILSDRTIPATITEYSTSDAAKNSSGLSITSTSISSGDRIKVTLKVRNVGTMAAGTVTNTYDGPTAAAAGDTYVTFSNLAIVQTATAALSATVTLSTLFPKTPPTFPDAKDLVEGTGARDFASVTTSAGDYIVVQAGVEDDAVTTSDLTVSAPGLSFDTQTDTGNSPLHVARVYQWTALDSTGGSRTVTITPQASLSYRARLTVVRGSDGPGNKTSSNVAQTVSLARLASNSALFINVSDWSTGAVGSPTWIPGGATVASEQGANGTYIFGRWDDSGTEATESTGISSPSYTTPAVAVLEMQGTTASTAVTGSATMSSTVTLSSTASNLVLSSAALTSQATQTAVSVVLAFGTSAFSSDTVLTVSGIVAKLGTSALAIQSTLSVSATVITLTAVSLSGQSSFTSSGSVLVLTNAGLTVQSGLNVNSLVTEFASSIQNAISMLMVQAIDTVPSGSITFDSQSTLTASGTIGATPVTSSLSGQSELTAIGSVITFGSVAFTSDLILLGNSLVNEFCTVVLTDDSVLTVNGITGRIGVSNLSSQSILLVEGFIPTVFFGQAALIADLTLEIDVQSSPPWIFKLIEFSVIRTTSHESAGGTKSSHREGSSKTISIEGG